MFINEEFNMLELGEENNFRNCYNLATSDFVTKEGSNIIFNNDNTLFVNNLGLIMSKNFYYLKFIPLWYDYIINYTPVTLYSCYVEDKIDYTLILRGEAIIENLNCRFIESAKNTSFVLSNLIIKEYYFEIKKEKE